MDSSTYKRWAKRLNRTRDQLYNVCYELGIDYDEVEDEVLEQYTIECSHCGIWGQHDHDDDGYFICNKCRAYE